MAVTITTLGSWADTSQSATYISPVSYSPSATSALLAFMVHNQNGSCVLGGVGGFGLDWHMGTWITYGTVNTYNRLIYYWATTGASAPASGTLQATFSVNQRGAALALYEVQRYDLATAIPIQVQNVRYTAATMGATLSALATASNWVFAAWGIQLSVTSAGVSGGVTRDAYATHSAPPQSIVVAHGSNLTVPVCGFNTSGAGAVLAIEISGNEGVTPIATFIRTCFHNINSVWMVGQSIISGIATYTRTLRTSLVRSSTATVSDNFARPDGTMGAPWINARRGIEIQGSGFYGTTALAGAAAFWNGSFSADQWAQVSVATIAQYSYLGAAVRTVASNYYYVQFRTDNPTPSYYAGRCLNAVGDDSHVGNWGLPCAVGDTIRLEVTGQNPVHVKAIFKGSIVTEWDDADANRLLTGQPGVNAYGSGAARGNNFLAGNIGVADSDNLWVSRIKVFARNILRSRNRSGVPATYSDNFNRSVIGADWTVQNGTFNIINSDNFYVTQPVPQVTVCVAAAYNNTVPAGSDQFSQILMASLTTSATYIGVGVCLSTNGGYTLTFQNAYGYLDKIDANGTFTHLYTFPSTGLVKTGDTLRLEKRGTVLYPYINGALYAAGTAQDTSYSVGYPGICGRRPGDGNTTNGDNWLGGTISSAGGAGGLTVIGSVITGIGSIVRTVLNSVTPVFSVKRNGEYIRNLSRLTIDGVTAKRLGEYCRNSTRLRTRVYGGVYSDNFNRADGDIGTSWQQYWGTHLIRNNEWQGGSYFAGGDTQWVGAVYQANFTATQSSQITVATLGDYTNYDEVGVCVRGNAVGGYCLSVLPTTWWIARPENNWTTYQLLQSDTNRTFVAGDVIKLQVVGTVISFFHNGTQVTAFEDVTYGSGAPGLSGWAAGTYNARGDNWVGIDLGVVPSGGLTVIGSLITGAGAIARAVINSIAPVFTVRRLGEYYRWPLKTMSSSSAVKRVGAYGRTVLGALSIRAIVSQARGVMSRTVFFVKQNTIFAVSRLTERLRTTALTLSPKFVVSRGAAVVRAVLTSLRTTNTVKRVGTFARTLTHTLRPLFSIIQTKSGIYIRYVATGVARAMSVKRVAQFFRGINIIRPIAKLVGRTRSIGLAVFMEIGYFRPHMPEEPNPRQFLINYRTEYIRRLVSLISPVISVRRLGQFSRTLLDVLRKIPSAAKSVPGITRSVITRLAPVSTVRRMGAYSRRLLTGIRKVFALTRIGQYIRRLIIVLRATFLLGRASLTFRTLVTAITPRITLKRLGQYTRKTFIYLNPVTTIARVVGFVRRITSTLRVSFGVARIKLAIRTLVTALSPVFSIRRVVQFMRNLITSLRFRVSPDWVSSAERKWFKWRTTGAERDIYKDSSKEQDIYKSKESEQDRYKT